VRRRHARFFLDLAERAEPQINTRDRGRWLDRLEAEHDNFRAVLAAADVGDDIRARLAGGWPGSGDGRAMSPRGGGGCSRPQTAVPMTVRR